MNQTDALNAALHALDKIDKLAEGASVRGDDPRDAVEDIHTITGDLIGELARAGFKSA